MDFSILGPLEVRTSAGAPVDIGPRKVRLALAVLLLHAGRPVTVDALADVTWPRALPANPSGALRTNIARLRRALAESGAPDRIVTVGDAYRLDLDAAELDAFRFEALAAQGTAALAAGDAATASTRLRAALRLWRGPLLGEFGGLDFAAGAARRYEEVRLRALEDRVEADLVLGRARDLVSELETLTAAHPLRERLWELLARALAGTGRSADALARLARARSLLAAEVGVDAAGLLREVEDELRHGRPAPSRVTADAVAAVTPAAALDLSPAVDRICERRLVGRHDELARSEAASELARATGTAVILVTGEAGIGKSRFVGELLAHAHERGWVTLYGRCEEHPLAAGQPFGEMLRGLAARFGPELVDALGPLGGELTRLVPELAVSTGAPSALPGGGEHELSLLTARAVSRALELAAGGAPTMVALDDLQWADALTLRLAAHLSSDDRPRPLCMLATCRPDPEPGTPVHDLVAAWGRAGTLEAVRLAGLSVEELDVLVTADAGVPVLAGAGSALHSYTGGNPFFALQLVRHLEERDVSLTELAAAPPAGLVAVIDGRVHDLGGETRAALEVAALLGTAFWSEVVNRSLGVDARSDLDRAVVAGLLAEQDGAGRLGFVHGLVRDVLVARLAPGRRQELHHRIAGALQEVQPAGRVEIARHLSRAGVAHRDEAIASAAAAAADAIGRRAYEDAADLCALGLRMLADTGTEDERHLELLLLLTRAQRGAGLHRAGRDTALTAADLARSRNHPERFAVAVLAAMPNRPDPALLPVLEAALDAVGDDGTRTELQVHLAWALAEHDRDAAGALIEGARLVAVRDGIVGALHRILTHDFEFGVGIRAAARAADARRLVEVAAAVGAVEALVDGYSYAGTALLELGDVAAARAMFACHERLAGDLRIPLYLAVDDQRRAMFALLEGRYDAAERRLHDAMLHVADEAGYTAVYGAQLIAIRFDAGRFDEVLALLDAAGEFAELPLTRACRAATLAELGRGADSVAELDRACGNGWSGLRRDMFWKPTLAQAAHAAARAGAPEHCAAVYELLAPFRHELVVFAYGAVCLGSVHGYLARLAEALDRRADAAVHYRAAITAHERLRATPYARRDRAGLERVLAEAG